MNLIYSVEALADLARVRAFIARENPAAAGRIAASLVERIDNLLTFPEMGVAVAEAPDPDAIRDLFVDSYVVRYAIHAGTVFVLRVWHGREDRGNNIK